MEKRKWRGRLGGGKAFSPQRRRGRREKRSRGVRLTTCCDRTSAKEGASRRLDMSELKLRPPKRRREKRRLRSMKRLNTEDTENAQRTQRRHREHGEHGEIRRQLSLRRPAFLVKLKRGSSTARPDREISKRSSDKDRASGRSAPFLRQGRQNDRADGGIAPRMRAGSAAADHAPTKNRNSRRAKQIPHPARSAGIRDDDVNS